MSGALQGLQDWAAELRELQKPLCIDLFCGLGGWTEGFLAENYRVVGFDIEIRSYPAQLVIQDVLTIHGSQFKDAACIVCSPPCQKYSYLAMPWSRSVNANNSKAAKALRKEWETNGPDNRLFDACFRIQAEASLARAEMLGCCDKGNGLFPRHVLSACSRCFIPLIVENVRGAQPWVGRSAWNYGSFHLWGDVPALMPINLTRRMKSRIDCGPRMFSDRVASTPEEAHALHYRLPDGQKQNPDGSNHPRGSWFAIADSSQGDRRETKNNGGSWFNIRSPGQKETNRNPVHELATKSDREAGGWFNDYKGEHCVGISRTGSKSNARKMASAQIAKIPFELARHVAQVYYPRSLEQAAGGPRRMGKTE